MSNLPTVTARKFNATRAAAAAARRTGVPHIAQAVSGGYIVVPAAEPEPAAATPSEPTVVLEEPVAPAPTKAAVTRKKLRAEVKAAAAAFDKAAEEAASRRAKGAKPAPPTRAARTPRAPSPTLAPGELPSAPDFSSIKAYLPYRKKLGELQALIDAGDADAVAAFQVRPTCTGPKMLIRYRDQAVAALRARAA